MEVKVGEYVRTRAGQIGIFKRYAEEGMFQWFEMIQESTLYTLPTIAITRYSKNIIDLIEVRRYSIYTRCIK